LERAKNFHAAAHVKRDNIKSTPQQYSNETKYEFYNFTHKGFKNANKLHTWRYLRKAKGDFKQSTNFQKESQEEKRFFGLYLSAKIILSTQTNLTLS